MKLLRLCGQMSAEETRAVRLETKDGRLCVNAGGTENGEADLSMEAQIEGGELSASFNFAYLIDGLKVLADETVTIHFRDADMPIRFDSGDYTHVLMSITRGR
jgi:DNA polymerase-3 subunit beta